MFEVLSPGNRAGELRRKLALYSKCSAEEHYVLDPDREFFRGYLRGTAGLAELPAMNKWVSPRLGVRFADDPEPHLYGPDGQRFLSIVEIGEQAGRDRARADSQTQRAEVEKRRADKLAAKLRALGLDPDTL